MRALVPPEDDNEFRDWLFTRPAFYAEFAALPQHKQLADHLYAMRDRGTLTCAGQSLFASPFSEVCFTFRDRLEGGSLAPSVVVVQPSFGHRKRKRALRGWALGIRSHASSPLPPASNHPALGPCLAELTQVIGGEPSCSVLLQTLDQLLDDLSKQTEIAPSSVVRQFFQLSQLKAGVAKLASALGQSARTLQRRVRTSTGLSPKQFLAVERFDHAVHAIPTPDAKLSHVAEDLRFSDQPHLTREFQRHAGLSPGAFRQMWQGSHGQAVRFFQDSSPTVRLRTALWATEDGD